METVSSIIAPVIVLLMIVLIIAGMWKVFQKAGESGWKALIPFYNIYIMFRISGHSGWWLAALFLPLFAIIAGAFTVDAPEMFSPAAGGLSGFGLFVNLFAATIQISVLVSAVMLYDVSRSFGKSLAFTIGLGILPFVFWPMLGFGDASYRGPVAHPKMVGKGSGAHIETNKTDKEEPETNRDESDDQQEKE